jgi:tetratricopeptide (TPR) repeat protein
MDTLICEKCHASMALAETLCVKCGHPAPAGRAAQILKAKAEDAFEQGRLDLALRQMTKAVESGMDSKELPLAWRKLGVWHEKRHSQDPKPEFLASAENSYFKALSLDDADDLAHQLFIACLGKQGQTLRAVTFYQQRFAKNPEDVVAQKHLNAIKLAGDIKAAPRPAELHFDEGGMFGRQIRKLLKPSPWKVVTLLGGLVFNLIQLFTKTDAHDVSLLTSGEGVPASALDMVGLFSDPWVVGFQALGTALLLFFMFRSR